MREIEIRRDLGLNARATRLLDAHSALNLLHIVLLHIGEIGTLLDDVDAVVPLTEWGQQQVSALRDGLGKPGTSARDLAYLEHVRAHLLGGLYALRPRVPAEKAETFERRLEALTSVFDVAQARIADWIGRADDMGHCRSFTLEELRANLESTFRAVEKSGMGRYRIAFSAATRAPGDYLMEFDLRSRDGHSIYMPAVLQDVMRDLASNARKYTDPGGWVRLTLAEDDGILLQVEDNGRGIPDDEIEAVVSFGYRATNFAGRAQAGGGFGLTKAYAVTRHFGGRMWIRSGVGAGTRVTIRLPEPVRPGTDGT